MNSKYGLPKLVPALILVYDIVDFTRFFNQPDVFNYAPIYLNTMDEVITCLLKGTKLFWSAKTPRLKHNWHKDLLHRKFLGDGELLIFQTKNLKKNQSDMIKSFINDIWNLIARFEKVNDLVRTRIPVAELPGGIRFSMTRGTVMELTSREGDKEYLGFPLNLAGRLQSYCRDLRFIASAKIGPQQIRKNSREFKRLVTKKIKGYPPELVYVDTLSYNKLSKKEQKSLFREI